VQGGRILVIGATGRVGGAAVRHLLEAGFDVRALVRSAERGRRLRSSGAQPVVGDVTEPETLAPALAGCAGVSRFVYSSALLVDHPLAQAVGTLREKARFEEILLGADDVSPTVLRPVMFMETLLLALRGPVAFVPGRQRRPVRWIFADDVAHAAVRAFERDVTGRHELAGSDRGTFDEAYRRLSRAWGRRIAVLHPPLATMRLAGRFSAPVEELANLFALFDTAGYASGSPALRETFGIQATTIEEWAARVSRRGWFG
jgi:uncharacterized protein YbjT (DUF2867 family)